MIEMENGVPIRMETFGYVTVEGGSAVPQSGRLARCERGKADSLSSPLR